jgi:hypothetical protein
MLTVAELTDGVYRSHHLIWFCGFEAAPLQIHSSTDSILDTAFLSHTSSKREVLLIATSKQLLALTFSTR